MTIIYTGGPLVTRILGFGKTRVSGKSCKQNQKVILWKNRVSRIFTWKNRVSRISTWEKSCKQNIYVENRVS